MRSHTDTVCAADNSGIVDSHSHSDIGIGERRRHYLRRRSEHEEESVKQRLCLPSRKQ
jgi:hypothetical protein